MFSRTLCLVLISVAGFASGQIHFQPEEGVLGDTIPFYWQGEYHIFYLKGSSWGHVKSDDLVHWKNLPDALKKGEEPESPDGENCWTGSIVEKDGVFTLFYTGKNSRDPKGDQKVMSATSKDLTQWTKHPDRTFYADGTIYWSKPVNGPIDDRQIYHHQAFRDPEVLRDNITGKWMMLLHAALSDGSAPAFARYESADLGTWTPCKPLMVLPKTLSADCPHLFEMAGKWYLIAADRHYTSGPAQTGPFSTEMKPYEAGELFVPKTLFDGQRRILAGWIADREGSKDSGKGTWGGTMCMPRELYADASGQLCQRPPKEVINLFKNDILKGKRPPLNTPVTIPKTFMFHCNLRAEGAADEIKIEISRGAPPDTSVYRISVRFSDGLVRLADGHRTYDQICKPEGKPEYDIRIFVADTVTECFVNNKYVLDMRTYDERPGELTVFANPKETTLANLELMAP